jgi:hypothetical protein
VVPYCTVELMLYMNGEPRLSLTRETPLVRSRCSVLLSSRTHQVDLARGFTVCEVVAEAGDAFEVYIRHDCGEQAHLTPHYSDAADRSAFGQERVGGPSSHLLYGGVARVSEVTSHMRPGRRCRRTDYLTDDCCCLRSWCLLLVRSL